MELKDTIKSELRKEPEDWSCKFSQHGQCIYAHAVLAAKCEGKHQDRKHCPIWRRRS